MVEEAVVENTKSFSIKNENDLVIDLDVKMPFKLTLEAQHYLYEDNKQKASLISAEMLYRRIKYISMDLTDEDVLEFLTSEDWKTFLTESRG